MTSKKVGGRRPGSGRPPKPPEEKHVRLYFSLPPHLAERVLKLERRSEWLAGVVERELKERENDDITSSQKE